MPQSGQLADATDRLVRSNTDLTRAVETDGWAEAPELLEGVERALLSLSAGWHGLAALAAPTIAGMHGSELSQVPAETGLSREQEVMLISTLHDVATDLAAAARSCRNGREMIEPLVERRLRANGALHPDGQDRAS